MTILLIWVFVSFGTILFFYGPSIYLSIRHLVDDISFSALMGNKKGDIVNDDGTAFNGNWWPIVVAIAVIFLFLLLLVL